MQAKVPKKIPKILKKLIEPPALPLILSGTKDGANPKHKLAPIPLIKANRLTFIITKLLLNSGLI